MSVPVQDLLVNGMVADEPALDPGMSYGEVFTRRWVVEFILDLVGYTDDGDLGALRLVEPSCGSGAFLVPVVDRLVASARRHHRHIGSLEGAVRAFDLSDANVKLARKAVSVRLQETGVDHDTADEIAKAWVSTGDFLLARHERGSADFVVGNPPYVRLEDVPRGRMAAYRSVNSAMRGRADLYVGFIEAGVSLLRPGGALGFICADRWMRNQYGRGLRDLVSRSYAVDAVVSMHDVDAFEDEVSAYPAVVVIRNRRQNGACVVDVRTGFDGSAAGSVVEWSRNPDAPEHISGRSFEGSRLPRWFSGRDPWPSGRPSQLALIAELERRFAPLEDVRTRTKVGIGVATGCDDVYITDDPDLIEPDRLLPLLRSGDTVAGFPDWSGTFLVNPWDANGLVRLSDYPRLRRYLNRHADRLQQRHVARRRPQAWYRTIDRVDPGLSGRTKLVLPDMKAFSHPVLVEGMYYPHHNLYYVTSETWDPEVLGALLLCDIANLFVGSYCVRMRGGCYRFQAQYIRRIRLPEQSSIDSGQARDLVIAFRTRDRQAANEVAAGLYGINASVLHNLKRLI